jgi:YidC/Oxa1 family membrane protein insertase
MVEFLQDLFTPLTGIFGNVLEFFYALGVPWWLSIVLLTVIVRSLLFPLTAKQVKSMRAMQDLKPEMDKVRAKYKDNRQKQQEEIMKLYQERKVNPLGGCFPLVIQMPIFITMFYVIRSFDQTHPSFASGGILWFKDLTVADPYYILPVLSAVTMFAASQITSKNLDPQQRWLMRILPVAFTVFLLRFPAGLFMYWITSNLVTLIQNYLIYNHGPGKKSPAADKQQALADKAPSVQSSTPTSQNSAVEQKQRPKGTKKRRKRKR